MSSADLRLFLVHHGEAVSPDVDPMRPLSTVGREKTLGVAAEAAARKVTPRAIWHSGKLRARQTGEILRDACSPSAEFKAQPGLQPDESPDRITDLLRAETGELMVVGHMPHLPRLLAVLVGTSGAEGFPMNGVVALERRDGRWSELWRLSPGDPPPRA